MMFRYLKLRILVASLLLFGNTANAESLTQRPTRTSLKAVTDYQGTVIQESPLDRYFSKDFYENLVERFEYKKHEFKRVVPKIKRPPPEPKKVPPPSLQAQLEELVKKEGPSCHQLCETNAPKDAKFICEIENCKRACADEGTATSLAAEAAKLAENDTYGETFASKCMRFFKTFKSKILNLPGLEELAPNPKIRVGSDAPANGEMLRQERVDKVPKPIGTSSTTLLPQLELGCSNSPASTKKAAAAEFKQYMNFCLQNCESKAKAKNGGKPLEKCPPDCRAQCDAKESAGLRALDVLIEGIEASH
jgi:hypothetical protein